MEGPEVAGLVFAILILIFFAYICLTSLKKNNSITTENNQEQV